jgi:high affinity Mn2+ porin
MARALTNTLWFFRSVGQPDRLETAPVTMALRNPTQADAAIEGLARKRPSRSTARCNLARLTVAATVMCASPAVAQMADPQTAAEPADTTAESLAIHGQATVIDQGVLGFHAPYAGPNSLTPSQGRETFDATLYVGFRPWRGAEVWINPEIDQGFGLDNTLGVAGFPSGEAYKVGASTPYFKLPRAFLRQTIDLGGERQKIDPDQNQLGGSQTADRLVLWIGKFSVTDVFDTNKYAHDPRGDFMNWTLIDTGTFDYAADAWGYTYGAAAEWYQGGWTLRGGLFDLSSVPNSPELDPTFGQFQIVGELERRFQVKGQPGAVRVTGFLSRGRMGRYDDATSLAGATSQPANVALVRHYASRGGESVTLEQQVNKDLGLFVRAGVADGSYEAYEFTDVDKTVSAGASLSGGRWGRSGDTIGLAGVLNGASNALIAYLNAGGLGILVGDGKLPHPGPEEIIEAYYKIAVTPKVALSLDMQLVGNPGYNRDRGPAPVVAARLHAQF